MFNFLINVKGETLIYRDELDRTTTIEIWFPDFKLSGRVEVREYLTVYDDPLKYILTNTIINYSFQEDKVRKNIITALEFIEVWEGMEIVLHKDIDYSFHNFLKISFINGYPHQLYHTSIIKNLLSGKFYVTYISKTIKWFELVFDGKETILFEFSENINPNKFKRMRLSAWIEKCKIVPL